MTTRLMWTMVLAAGFILAGCDAWPGSPSKQSQAMVGKWVGYDGPIVTRYQLNADGTCARLVHVPLAAGPADESQKGTWNLGDDSVLSLEFSNGSPDPVEEMHRVRLTERSLVLIDNGREQVFQREE